MLEDNQPKRYNLIITKRKTTKKEFLTHMTMNPKQLNIVKFKIHCSISNQISLFTDI